MLNDGHGVGMTCKLGKRDIFTNQHWHPRHFQDLHMQRMRNAQAPVLGLVFVHRTVLHRSKKQYLVLVTLFGPMTTLDGGNLVLKTTNWHLVRRTVLENVSRSRFVPLSQRTKISPFNFLKTLGKLEGPRAHKRRKRLLHKAVRLG
jgi:hypothetical protein